GTWQLRRCLTDVDSRVREKGLERADGGAAVVQDAGDERGVGVGAQERIADVGGRARTSAGHDRHADRLDDARGQVEVVAAAAAVAVDARDENLARAELRAAAGPRDGIELGGAATAVGEHAVPGSGLAAPLLLEARVDAGDDALPPEALGGLGEQLRTQ